MSHDKEVDDKIIQNNTLNIFNVNNIPTWRTKINQLIGEMLYRQKKEKREREKECV